MIAVTIGIGRYAELARLAAATFSRKTGLECRVLGAAHLRASGLRSAYALKFRLFDLVDAEDLFYFDADMVCLRAWQPEALAGPDCTPEDVAKLVRFLVTDGKYITGQVLRLDGGRSIT
jgi:NAD(P)-dependent dehydrogenase (short-subunit alcohol dehydrogenase family)